MPVVPVIPPLLSPPTNCFGLVQYLAQRLPGYDFSEYLREINSAYVHVWEEISKLKNNYFTNKRVVTVAKPQTAFDFLYNADGGLNAPLSNRLYQITKIRVQAPGSQFYQNCVAFGPNDPNFIGIAAGINSSPQVTGPYYYYLYGRGNIQWALPIAAGTNFEITYTFWPLALTYLTGGTISSPTSATFNITSISIVGSAVSMDYSGTLLPVIGQVVNVANVVGGTAVLNGAHTITGGSAGTVQFNIGAPGSAGTGGTVSFTGPASQVFGAATNFTQLLQPDFQSAQPDPSTSVDQEATLAELVCNGNQIYAVGAIANDTELTTLTGIAPALPVASQYVLALLPEIPREHIRVIASIALAKMYSVDGDDARVREWSQISMQNMQMMKDSLMERTSQNPPMKQRFPFSIGRGNRGFFR